MPPGDGSSAAAIRELTERIGQLELGQAQLSGQVQMLATQVGTACGDMKAMGSRIEDHEKRIVVREVAYKERIEPALDQLAALATRLEVLAVSVQRGAVSGGAIGGAGGAAALGLAVGIIGKIAGWW